MPATSENGQYIASGAPVLANAFVSGPGVNTFKAIPSSPGRTVQFRAGTAPIRDERDLIACLRHPDVQVVVASEYVDWIADRMNECGTAQPPQGELTLPAGYVVEGEPGDYVLFGPADTKARPEPLLDLPDIDDTAPLPEGVEPGKWRPGGPGRPPKSR